MPAAAVLSLITAVTLNAWMLPDAGLRVLSPLRAERARGICAELRRNSDSRGAWDVVLLQEMWTQADRKSLQDCGFPHLADLENAARIVDSGLLILSRHPLGRVKRFIHTSPEEAGLPPIGAEGLARKSALAAEVLHPAGVFWVVNTHLIARYESRRSADYDRLRALQFSDFISWAEEVSEGAPLLVGGDWNVGPGDPEWPEISRRLGDYSGSRETPCTYCPPNSYVERNEGTLDHLYLRAPGRFVRGERAFADPVVIRGESLHLSDHFGWKAVFELPN